MRNFGRFRDFTKHFNCALCSDILEFIALELDFVAEAAIPKR